MCEFGGVVSNGYTPHSTARIVRLLSAAFPKLSPFSFQLPPRPPSMCEDMSQFDPTAMGKRLCGQFPVASEADCHADAIFVHVGGDMGCVFPNMYVASDQECKALVNNGDNYHYEDKSCGDFRSEASSINANENGWCMGQSKDPINYPPYEGCCGSSPTLCASLPACVDDEGRLQAESGQQMQSCAEGVDPVHNYCFDDSYLVDQQGADPGWFKSVCCDTCAKSVRPQSGGDCPRARKLRTPC